MGIGRFRLFGGLEYNPALMAKAKKKNAARGSKSARTRRRKASRPVKSAKLPKDAVALAVVMHAKPGQEEMLRAELTALVKPTRSEVGCILYDLHRSPEIPGDFLFYEIWESREAHAAHKQTPHFLRWNARKDAVLAAREFGFWKKII